MDSKKTNNRRALKEISKFLCFFIGIFLIVFIGLNFESIYAQLRYKPNQEEGVINKTGGETGETIETLENEEPSESSPTTNTSIEKEQLSNQFGDLNTISIPKIRVNAPIVVPKSEKEKNILLSLKKGVALYPSSVLPGEKGTTIISGHSSRPIFYSGNYNTVFTLLNKLEEGDDIIIYYNQEKYVYKVKNKYIFSPQEEILPTNTGDKSILVLISCWPIGTDWKRIAVEAELCP
jgi:sortase A